jgi:DeoR family transcriptional regulator of aga operon
LESQLNALMIKVARETTVVCDSSKLGRRSLSVIGKADSAHRVITDEGASPELVAQLRARNLEVILV